MSRPSTVAKHASGHPHAHPHLNVHPSKACAGCHDSFVANVSRGFGPIVAYVIAGILFLMCALLLARASGDTRWFVAAFLLVNIGTVPAIFGVTRTALPADLSVAILLVAAVSATVLLAWHVSEASLFRLFGRGALNDYAILAELSLVLVLWVVAAWYCYVRRELATVVGST